MKRETIRHPKTYDLASRLNCSRPEALGFLTLLWDFTADIAPEGDVGKWSNGVIARACDWTGDPDLFVRALVESHWLDEDPQHRLIVHDVAEHAERWWKLKLEKLNKTFVTPSTEISIEGSTDAATEGSIEVSTEGGNSAAPRSAEAPTEASASRDLTKPNQTEPFLLSAGADNRELLASREAQFVRLWNAAPDVSKVQKVTDTRRKHLRARLKEPGWWEEFQEALKKFPISFKREDGTRWKPAVDWILKPDSVTKVLEGAVTGDASRKDEPEYTTESIYR